MRRLKRVLQERRRVQINVRHHNFYTRVAVGFIANTFSQPHYDIKDVHQYL